MSEYEMDVPDGWTRMERHCYPRNQSKAYKSDNTKANVHLVNMYDTGLYIVNAERANGDWIEQRCYNYFEALQVARNFMLNND